MTSLLSASPPSVAVDIEPGRVSAVSVAERGGRTVVSAHASEPLADGAVVPALNAANIADRHAVGEALGRVFERLGLRPRRVGLVIPDSAAKVSLIRLEHVPARAQDLEQIVRGLVRKTAPFRIEDAQVTFTPGTELPGGGREFVVVLARRDIIEEYESVCATVGAHAGLVDLATFNIINAMLAGGAPGQGDTLLVHVASTYTTLSIVRGADLIFYRTRSAEEEGSLADLVHQTAMYYEDRLNGGGFTRVVLAGAALSLSPADADELRRGLEDRLRTRVEPIDPRAAAAITDRIAAAPSLLDALAPLVGLLARERAA
jgi:type IV pilus assembly protein PilM